MSGRAFVVAAITVALAAAQPPMALVAARAPDAPRTEEPEPASSARSSPASSAAPGQPDLAVRARIPDGYGKLPLSFEPNQGQTDEEVEFLSRGNGYTIFLTAQGPVVALRKAAPRSDADVLLADQTVEEQVARDVAVRVSLAGANGRAEAVGLEALPGKVNYFIGNDPARWRTNVPTYAKVRYRDVYPGIDLVYHGDGRQLEYDFVVGRGADPARIALRIEGAEAVRLDASGDLVIGVPGGEIRQRRPVVYQEADGARRALPGEFVLLADGLISFRVGAYDASLPLVIDPVLAYSTYLGGSDNEQGFAIAVDSSGSAYVTGFTRSPNFPTTPAPGTPFQGTFQGGGTTATFIGDAFVTKLNAAGTARVYSTYLGGSAADEGHGIAVDGSGNAYVTGFTASANFPTLNAAQPAFGGGAQDAFVTKLNPDGSALVYSTYLGGAGDDVGLAIAVDASGSAHVTGFTDSANFPVLSATQPTLGGTGTFDAFVAKFSATGTKTFATYFGGSGNDFGRGIALDGAGNIYLTGDTSSTNFPTTTASPALQATFGGVADAFVTKLTAAGACCAYSTYLGGSGFDAGIAIAVDSSGNAYVTGQTSSNFPTANAAQATPGGSEDAFVAKLNAAGNALLYSTYLGGSGPDFGVAIAVDGAGFAYVAGRTDSANFPTASAFQPTFGGLIDGFVTKVSPTGSSFAYSSYLGGSGDDRAQGIAVDSSGSAYVTGFTASSNFPTTTGSFQTVTQGNYDAFIAKISADVLILGSSVTTPTGGQSREAQAATALGLTVEVADDATWKAKTTTVFAAYKAIILGDPTCSASPTTSVAAAEQTTATWGPAITGNVVVIGTDPVFHFGTGNAATLISNGIKFATSLTGKTGAYITLSCYYAGATAGTAAPVLNGIAVGGFTVQGQGSAPSGCPNNSHIVAPTHPAMAGITDAGLSNWSCSTHEVFNTWPSTFQVLAITKDINTGFTAADGTVGAPYILARSPVTTPSTLKLAPATATNPVGAGHTLTATATENGAAAASKTVTFKVLTGPSAGTTGTGTTDTSGNATFTYKGTAIGTDTIVATFVDSSNVTVTSNTVTKTWVALAGTAACFETDGTTVTRFLLPGATILFRKFGDTANTTFFADLVTGAFVITGLPANTTYSITYQGMANPGTPKARPLECSTAGVTGAFGDGVVPDSAPEVNYKNHEFFKAKRLTSGQTIPDRLFDSDRQFDWYVVSAPTGAFVTFRVGDVPFDVVALGFGDLVRISGELGAQTGSGAGIKAALAGGVPADDITGDDITGDDITGDDITGDDITGDDITGDDITGDDITGDDITGDDITGADVTNFGPTYTAAQRKGMRALSQHRGLVPEVVTLHMRGRPGDVYFAVRGHAGAFDRHKTFTVSVTVGGTATCPNAITELAPSTTTLPAGAFKTLILYNSERLRLVQGTADQLAFNNLLAQVVARPEVQGFAFDLSSDASIKANYAAWDLPGGKTCVEQANAVARSIKQLVNLARATWGVQNVTTLGVHNAVPFYSVPDTVPDALSPESKYHLPADPTSPTDAQFAGDFQHTLNFYIARFPTFVLGQELWVPDDGMAVSNIPESVADITAYLQGYLDSSGVLRPDGVKDPKNVLDMGYLWNKDLANSVASELSWGNSGLVIDALLVRDDWTAQDVKNKLLPPSATRYAWVEPLGHFTATTFTPAAGTDKFTAPSLLTNDGRFKNSFWETLGCHSFLPVPDSDIVPGVTQPRGFAETLTSQQIGMAIGQVNYAYGGDAATFLENTEVVLAILNRQLRTGLGPKAPAHELATALRKYVRTLTTVPLNPVRRKVVHTATAFGLATWAIDIPGDRHPIDSDKPIDTTNGIVTTTATFAATGRATSTLTLASADVSPKYTLRQTTAGYFEAVQQIDPTTTVADATGDSGKPILPRVVVGTTTKDPSLVETGVVLKSATYHDVTPYTPVIDMAITELAQPAPSYTSSTFIPGAIGQVNQYADQSLVVVPAQLNMNGAIANGTLRLYDSATFTVYFSNQTGAGALDAATIVGVALEPTTVNNKVHVTVRLRTTTSPGIEKVFATFRGSATGLATTWTSLELKRVAGPTADGGGFVSDFGTVAGDLISPDIDPLNADPTSVELFIQAVATSGIVSRATNNGQYFRLAAAAATPPKDTVLTLQLPFDSASPTFATSYKARVPVSAKLTDSAGQPLGGKTIWFGIPGRQTFGVSDNLTGIATAAFVVTAPPGDRVLNAVFNGDAATNPSFASHAVTVVKGATSFSLTAPASLHYTENADIGSLIVLASGRQLQEQPFTMTLPDGRKIFSITNGVGRIRFDTLDAGGIGPGTYTIGFSYDGTDFYAPTTGSLAIVVLAKPVTTFAYDTTPQPENTAFTITAQLTDTTGIPGDLTRAQVSWTLTPETVTTTTPVVTQTTSVTAAGVSTATFTLPASVYTVDAVVTGFYTSAHTTALLPVFDPSTFVTGGGNVITPAISVNLPAGKKANFGFNLKYLTGTTTPTGSVLFQLQEANITLKATSFDWLVITSVTGGKRAELQGTATINGTGTFGFRMIVDDLATDDFGITIWDPSAGQSFANPKFSLPATNLNGGSIIVH